MTLIKPNVSPEFGKVKKECHGCFPSHLLLPPFLKRFKHYLSNTSSHLHTSTTSSPPHNNMNPHNYPSLQTSSPNQPKPMIAPTSSESHHDHAALYTSELRDHFNEETRLSNTEHTEANPDTKTNPDNVTSAETKLMDRLAKIKLGEGNPLSTPNGAQTDSDYVTRNDGSNYKHHGDDEATCQCVKRIVWREGLLQTLGKLHGSGNCRLSLGELIDLDDNACLVTRNDSSVLIASHYNVHSRPRWSLSHSNFLFEGSIRHCNV